MKNKTEVSVAGKKYNIVGFESSDYIVKVAKYVDDKMRELMKGDKRLTAESAAILTALNVADDYFKAEESAKSLREQVGSFLKGGNA
jgi:cell division protein ZapA